MLNKFVVLFVLLPAVVCGLECIFHTEPIHPVDRNSQGKNNTGATEYTCPSGDKYCVFFEGTVNAEDKQQKFGVRGCESHLADYLGPISTTIGHRIDAKCKGDGKMEKKVGGLSYYLNCCTEPDCDTINAAPGSKFSWSVLTTLSAILLMAPIYA